jgi:hypothetical protein
LTFRAEGILDRKVIEKAIQVVTERLPRLIFGLKRIGR